MNLVEFLQSIVDNPVLLQRFQADPEAVLTELGGVESLTTSNASAPNNQFSVLSARDGSTNVFALKRSDAFVGGFRKDSNDVFPSQEFSFTRAEDTSSMIDGRHVVTNEIHNVRVVELKVKILDSSMDAKPVAPIDPALTLQICNPENNKRYALVTRIEGIDEYSQWLNGLLGPMEEVENRTSYQTIVENAQVLYAYDMIHGTYHGAETVRIVLEITNSSPND